MFASKENYSLLNKVINAHFKETNRDIPSNLNSIIHKVVNNLDNNKKFKNSSVKELNKLALQQIINEGKSVQSINESKRNPSNIQPVNSRPVYTNMSSSSEKKNMQNYLQNDQLMIRTNVNNSDLPMPINTFNGNNKIDVDKNLYAQYNQNNRPSSNVTMGCAGPWRGEDTRITKDVEKENFSSEPIHSNTNSNINNSNVNSSNNINFNSNVSSTDNSNIINDLYQNNEQLLSIESEKEEPMSISDINNMLNEEINKRDLNIKNIDINKIQKSTSNFDNEQDNDELSFISEGNLNQLEEQNNIFKQQTFALEAENDIRKQILGFEKNINLEETKNELDSQFEIPLKIDTVNNNKYIFKDHYVTVDSLDRDINLWNYSNNYQIKFAPDSSQSKSYIPITFKNVYSIELVSAILPYAAKKIPNTSVSCNILQEPYIIISIDEIEGPYYGTNLTNNQAFAKLIHDGYFSTEYVQFKVNGEKKEYPNLLGSIDKFTFKFFNNKGQIYDFGKDYIEIDTSAYTSTSEGYGIIEITLKDTFNLDVGDSIYIYDHTFETSDATPVDKQDLFNDVKHHLIEVDSANKIIKIGIEDISSGSGSGGYIIIKKLQNNLTFKITTRDYESVLNNNI